LFVIFGYIFFTLASLYPGLNIIILINYSEEIKVTTLSTRFSNIELKDLKFKKKEKLKLFFKKS
jgi:hypothetical protein